MRLRIFGRTADEKGSQLESLTQRLLMRLGYKDVTLNVIGAGGNELDVRASYPLPGLSGTETIPLVGECKAYESPLNVPDWLKFLGKVYTENARHTTEVHGVLIALGGVNGNVAGAAMEFAQHRKNVSVVTGERLMQLTSEEFGLAPLAQVSTFLQHASNAPATELSVGYYAGAAFWIAQLSDGTFTLLAGASLNVPISDACIALVEETLPASGYRDLKKEAEVQQRGLAARQLLLSSALLADRAQPRSALVGQAKKSSGGDLATLTDPEFDAGISTLRLERLLILDSDDQLSLADVLSDIGIRLQFLRTLTDGFTVVHPWGTPQMERLLDGALLDKALEAQGALPLDAPDREAALNILRLSPGAVAWAIRPDPMLAAHRNQSTLTTTPDQNMDSNDVRYFHARLIDRLQADFKTGPYSDLFFNKLGIREMEIRNRVALKSSNGIAHEFDIVERRGIYKSAPDMGGGLVHVWMHSAAPQPWEPPFKPADSTTVKVAPPETPV